MNCKNIIVVLLLSNVLSQLDSDIGKIFVTKYVRLFEFIQSNRNFVVNDES